MFAVATFAIGVGAPGAVARRCAPGRRCPSDNAALALTSLVRRNRRRYGGYLVHIGISVLFVGVAASSAFNGERDIRLAPGQSTTVKGYTFTYVKPTGDASSSAPASSSGSRSARGSA